MDSFCIDNIHELGLLDDQTPHFNCFWATTSANTPFPLDYEGPVTVETSKVLFRRFSAQWLGFKAPMLYFAEKPSSKEFKCLNLQTTPCNLLYYTKPKSKMPCRVALRHHSKTMTFYFKDEHSQEAWVRTLRGICLMDDFSSQYSRGRSTIVEDLYSSFWARGKESGERFVAKIYALKGGSGQGEIVDQAIKKQMIFNDIQALRNISHPHIIKLQDLYEGNAGILAITQFIGGSTLIKHIHSKGHLKECETIYIMRTILQTIRDLHKQKILHRNLQPENILINYSSNGTQLKVIDFSYSCTLDCNDESSWHVSRNACQKPGTAGYMAPELCSGSQSSVESDIFSLGAIIYTCLTGEPLIKGKDIQEIFNKNKGMIIEYQSSEKWNSLSENARHIIEKMTDKDPKRRPSINSILEHPFFDTNGSHYEATTLHKNSIDAGCYNPRLPALSIDTKSSHESPLTNKASQRFMLSTSPSDSVKTRSPMTDFLHKQSTQIPDDGSHFPSARTSVVDEEMPNGNKRFSVLKPLSCYQREQTVGLEPFCLDDSEVDEAEVGADDEDDSPPVDDGAKVMRRNIKNLTAAPISNTPFSVAFSLSDGLCARKIGSLPEAQAFVDAPSVDKFSDHRTSVMRKFNH